MEHTRPPHVTAGELHRETETVLDRTDAKAADRAHAEWVKSGEATVPLEDLLRRYGVDR
jgi:hypothetical protein